MSARAARFRSSGTGTLVVDAVAKFGSNVGSTGYAGPLIVGVRGWNDHRFEGSW